VSASALSALPTPAASGTPLPPRPQTPLEFRLRADETPSGGQRVIAVVPELGIEQLLVEAPAPFVCQKALRPAGSEPRSGGSNQLDVFCGPQGGAGVTRDEGVLKLGKTQIPLPPGRSVSLRAVPQLELKAPTCDAASERVNVQLIARRNELKLEVPKLGLSLLLKQAAPGNELRCQTKVDQAALQMSVSCSDPKFYRISDLELFVIAGVLIVEDTWQHYERSAYSRWGIRLPCGQVQLASVVYPDARYVRTCTEKCLDRASACQSKCKPSDAEENLCADGCYELEGRCLRSCSD
jgi:hypothetical protein